MPCVSTSVYNPRVLVLSLHGEHSTYSRAFHTKICMRTHYKNKSPEQEARMAASKETPRARRTRIEKCRASWDRYRAEHPTHICKTCGREFKLSASRSYNCGVCKNARRRARNAHKQKRCPRCGVELRWWLGRLCRTCRRSDRRSREEKLCPACGVVRPWFAGSRCRGCIRDKKIKR